MAKRKPVVSQGGDNVMPQELVNTWSFRDIGKVYDSPWFDPEDLAHAFCEGKSPDEVAYWCFRWAKKRQAEARETYLASCPVRPENVSVWDFLRAHGFRDPVGLRAPKNRNRTFYEELGLKPPTAK